VGIEYALTTQVNILRTAYRTSLLAESFERGYCDEQYIEEYGDIPTNDDVIQLLEDYDAVVALKKQGAPHDVAVKEVFGKYGEYYAANFDEAFKHHKQERNYIVEQYLSDTLTSRPKPFESTMGMTREVDRWFCEAMSPWSKDVREDAGAIRRSYIYDGPAINEFMRSAFLRAGFENKQAEFSRIIQGLKASIVQAPTPEIRVFRGLHSMSNEEVEKMFAPGSCLVDPAYVSTTLLKEVTDDFCSKALIDIRITQATPIIPMVGINGNRKFKAVGEVFFGGEVTTADMAEVVLLPNTKIEVEKTIYFECMDFYYVYATVVS